MINILKKDTLIEDLNNYDFVIIPTNCYCTFPDGFARKIRKLYPYSFDADVGTKYGDKNKLGTIIEATKKGMPSFLILYVTFGYNFRPDKYKDYLDYDALETCLKRIDIEYSGKEIATPFIGCNRFDGNGDKERVKELLNKNIIHLNLTVYDYFQKSRDEEMVEIFKKEELMKNKNYKAYNNMVKKRKNNIL